MAMSLKKMLTEVVNAKASDLHLRVGLRPTLRIDGVLKPIDPDPLTSEDVSKIMQQMLNEQQLERYHQQSELDIALSV
ncbi:MAG: type IV pili twitching motility protein PilT, partial [candidate division Zixibacteria bacterium]|nr:type IV pili twitching motility protein PilT [candidate division Zixibacteria bacterium]